MTKDNDIIEQVAAIYQAGEVSPFDAAQQIDQLYRKHLLEQHRQWNSVDEFQNEPNGESDE